jgi:hypothetical protein
MKRSVHRLALAVSLAVSLSAARASDHIDGTVTAIDYAADLTDLYAFTSPKNPDNLVLILNVHGFATSASMFSNAVDYKLRVRPIADSVSFAASTDPSQEAGVVCTFAGGDLLDSNQRATCVFNLVDGTETITFHTRTSSFRAGGSGELGDLRAFAGVRSDPWFLDAVRTLMFNAGTYVEQSPGLNALYGLNVLSIVVEIPRARLPGALLAVSGQTVRR